jgi:hypothetical protein
MAKKTYLLRGFVTKIDEAFGKTANLFDLERWWRDTAKKMNTPFVDPCCLEASGYFQPVRFNSDEDVLERFNGTEWVPVLTSQITSDEEGG